MNLDTIPLFTILKSRLGYLSHREQLIAQNVANTDTPGYIPEDLKPFTLPPTSGAGSAGGALTMAAPASTGSAPAIGITPPSSKKVWKSVKLGDSETTRDGNQVVLEDEMAKMSESRMAYEAVIDIYQKSMDMLQMAGRPVAK
jgi:flagellar basal-body rod protein FlgB